MYDRQMTDGSVQAQRPIQDGDIFVQIRLKSGARIGPGKAELLEHIAASGSISEAGRRMSMSYRRAWILVSELNAAFAEAVVVTKVGGAPHQGARLTPFGFDLLERYRAFQSRTLQGADEFLSWLNDRAAVTEKPDR